MDSVKPSSPRIGDRSIIYLNITAADANGEVGFSTVHQRVSVQEAEGPSSRFVHLLVKRTGTADRVVVYWNITSTSATFFANDTGPQNGNVTFEEGNIPLRKIFQITCISKHKGFPFSIIFCVQLKYFVLRQDYDSLKYCSHISCTSYFVENYKGWNQTITSLLKKKKEKEKAILHNSISVMVMKYNYY